MNTSGPPQPPPKISGIRRLSSLLSPKERKRFLQLIPAIIFSALVEVIGISSVGPFLSIVAKPEIIQQNSISSWLYNRLNFTSDHKFLLFVGTIMFLFILFSKIMTAGTTWALLRFGWMRNHSISMRLLKNYLDKPYIFFLNRHSSDMMKNLISEVQQVAQGIILPTLDLIAQGVVATMIVILLIAVDPLLAISVGAGMGSAYAIIYAIIRQRMQKKGRIRQVANKSRYQMGSDALGGIKELKLLHREKTYLKGYRNASETYAKATVSQQVTSRLPRLVLEAIFFGGIVLVVLYLLKTRGDVVSILPVIGLYALASVRLLPALQHIFNSLTLIRFNSAALEVIIADLPPDTVEKPPAPSEPVVALPIQNSVSIHKLNFAYPNTHENFFEDLNLTIKAGTSVGIVGATGSGKSTLVDLLLGLLSPDSGYLEVDGVRVTEDNLRQWQSNLGYVPQQIFLTDNSIAQNIAFALPEEEIDMNEVERAAKAAQIHDFILGSLPQGYQTYIGERGVRLSGGQRQRLGIARALYSNPELIVFDEATSALDSVTEDYVFQALSALAGTKTLVIIAHRLTTVEMCDVIYLLEDGQIIDEGNYEDLYLSNPRFRALAGNSRTETEQTEPEK